MKIDLMELFDDHNPMPFNEVQSESELNYKQKYYQKNKQRCLDYQKNYNEKNDYSKNYYQNNKEVISEKNKLYYLKNKEIWNERNKLYYELNKKKINCPECNLELYSVSLKAHVKNKHQK